MRRLAALALSLAVVAAACGGDQVELERTTGAPESSTPTDDSPMGGPGLPDPSDPDPGDPGPGDNGAATSATTGPAGVPAEPAGPATPATPAPATPDRGTPGPTTETARPAVDACPTIPPWAPPDPARPTYAVDLSADPTTGVVEGTETVTFTPDLVINTLVFRLWANGPRPGSVGTTITIGAVTEGAVARRTEQPDPTTLVVHLDRSVRPGGAVTVTVPFRLQVNGPVNDRISRQSSSLRLASFLPLLAWEAGAGWAVEPPTSGFAEATTSPTADWDLQVRVPDGFSAIVSGIERAPGRWQADRARDVAVAVGRFQVLRATARVPGPVDVVVAVHDGIDDGARYLARVVAAIEAFSAWFGPYPWPTYQLSITPGLSGGIEYPMHVFQGPGTEGRTTSHEVAHMWFYGLVGNNQGRDPWLDEGLASYAEGRFEGTLGSMRAKAIPADGRGRAGASMAYWENHAGAYYRSVYVQSAAALSRVGSTDLVDCTLAHYVARNAWGVASPIDLYDSLDATFGDWRPALAPAGLGN